MHYLLLAIILSTSCYLYGAEQKRSYGMEPEYLKKADQLPDFIAKKTKKIDESPLKVSGNYHTKKLLLFGANPKLDSRLVAAAGNALFRSKKTPIYISSCKVETSYKRLSHYEIGVEGKDLQAISPLFDENEYKSLIGRLQKGWQRTSIKTKPHLSFVAYPEEAYELIVRDNPGTEGILPGEATLLKAVAEKLGFDRFNSSRCTNLLIEEASMATSLEQIQYDYTRGNIAHYSDPKPTYCWVDKREYQEFITRMGLEVTDLQG